MEHGLTPREQRFCREYVGNGGNGKAAAIEAGYGEAGAAVQSTRLLKRADIQAEIQRLRSGTHGVVGEMMHKAVMVINESRPSASENPERAAMYAEADKDLVAGLNRAYVIAGLMENFEMALGRKSKKLTRVLTKRVKAEDGTISTTVEAVQVEVFEVDHSGANRAGELLLEQCGADAPETANAGDNAVTPLLDAFRQGRVFEVRPEKAKDAR